MCNRFGVNYSLEAKRAAMGRTARGAAEAVITTLNLPISIEDFVEQIEDLYKEVFAEYVDFMPGAERLVRHLKEKGIPICIATSSKETTFKLKSKHHSEFFPLFSHIVKGSEDLEVKNGKPAPDIFWVAAKRFQQLPASMENVQTSLILTISIMAQYAMVNAISVSRASYIAVEPNNKWATSFTFHSVWSSKTPRMAWKLEEPPECRWSGCRPLALTHHRRKLLSPFRHWRCSNLNYLGCHHLNNNSAKIL